MAGPAPNSHPRAAPVTHIDADPGPSSLKARRWEGSTKNNPWAMSVQAATRASTQRPFRPEGVTGDALDRGHQPPGPGIPNTLVMALAPFTARSVWPGAEVPWALMWVMFAGRSVPAISQRPNLRMHAHQPPRLA